MELEPAPQLDKNSVVFLDWGLIDYNQALDRQNELLLKKRQGDSTDYVVFCTHPPVVTLGRATKSNDVVGFQGPLIHTNRGGRATYHGPHQVIVYPIIDLSRRGKDIHKYLRFLETLIIQTLLGFGISANAQPQAEFVTSEPEANFTGVWCGNRKIASIGIAVKHWISQHGLALNVLHDPSAFQGIRPCGFNSNVMTSMQRELGRQVDVEEVKSAFRRFFEF